MPPRTRKAAPRRPVILTPHSDNRKTGPVAVTYASQTTCPKSCPLLGKGCYAENGPMGAISTRLARSAGRTPPREIAQLEADLIDACPATQDLRLHGVGDCKDDQAAAIVAAAASRYAERGRRFGVKVWTYTHAWRTVKRESWGTVSVLASCHGIGEAEGAMALGYAAAVIVDSFDDGGKAYYESGNGAEPVRVIPCRYQADKTTCVNCRLCMDDRKLLESNSVIAFAAHGQRRASVLKSLL